jgi:hypothetical protein
MRFVLTQLLMLFLWSFGTVAQSQTPVFAPVGANDVDKESLIYEKRALLIFADSEKDPNFINQVESLAEDPGALNDRDVLVILDATPSPPSAWRQLLHPNGFSLVIFDKDGTRALRKPLPWSVREISHAIDKFSSRRSELLERHPAGR